MLGMKTDPSNYRSAIPISTLKFDLEAALNDEKMCTLVFTFGPLGPRAYDLWGPYCGHMCSTSSSVITLKLYPIDILSDEKMITPCFIIWASGAQGL